MLGDYEHNINIDYFSRKKKILIKGELEEHKVGVVVFVLFCF